MTLLIRQDIHPIGKLPKRTVTNIRSLKPGDPAPAAMTDFTAEYPVTIDENRQIDVALTEMIRVGVRALLVVADHTVVGLITSYDIQGERPLQFMQRSTVTRHDDIRVGDVMTPWAVLKKLDWRAVKFALVSDVRGLFDETQLTHLLVVDHDPHGATLVHGLISKTRLDRQLRTPSAVD